MKRNYLGEQVPTKHKDENDSPSDLQHYEDLAEDIDEVGEGSRRSPYLKVIAFICLLAFLGLALPNLSLLLKGMPSFLKQARSLSTQELVKISRPAVVKIDAVVIDSVLSNKRREGTGFNIASEGLVITNQHVVDNAREVTVSFPDGRFLTSNNIHSLPGMDMAIVALNGKDLPVLQPDFEQRPVPGDTLTIIGNPRGYEGIPTQGLLEGYISLPDTSQPLMLINASIGPGNSGSPVLNSQGMVVGVVFALRNSYLNSEDNQALAIPLWGLQNNVSAII